MKCASTRKIFRVCVMQEDFPWCLFCIRFTFSPSCWKYICICTLVSFAITGKKIGHIIKAIPGIHRYYISLKSTNTKVDIVETQTIKRVIENYSAYLFFSVLWQFSVGFACGAKISVDHHVDSNESMVRICWKSASSSLDSLRYRRCEMEDRSSQIGDRAYWWSKIEDPRAKAQALCERKQVRASSARKELKTWHPRWAASSWGEGWGGGGEL